VITEKDFNVRVRNLAAAAADLPEGTFNNAVLHLAADLIAARHRRNRQKLKKTVAAMGEHVKRRQVARPANPDATDDVVTVDLDAYALLRVQMAHAQNLHCGRMTCPRCNGRDVE
jgi:hypothetical protein